MPAITNPTPEVVLATFESLGTQVIPLDQIESTLIRKLIARAVVLGPTITTPDQQTEFDQIKQELAMRVFGREPFHK